MQRAKITKPQSTPFTPSHLLRLDELTDEFQVSNLNRRHFPLSSEIQLSIKRPMISIYLTSFTKILHYCCILFSFFNWKEIYWIFIYKKFPIQRFYIERILNSFKDLGSISLKHMFAYKIWPGREYLQVRVQTIMRHTALMSHEWHK